MMNKIKSFDLKELAENENNISPIGLLMITAIVNHILQPLVDHFDVKIKVVSFHKVVNDKEQYNSVEIKATQAKSKKLDRRVNNFELVQFLIKNDIYDQLELVGESKKDVDVIRISHKGVISNRKEMLFSGKNIGPRLMSRIEKSNYKILK